MHLMFRRRRPLILDPADLAAAAAMTDRLERATWEELGTLDRAYGETWQHLPYGGVPKGRLPSEPDSRIAPEADRLRTLATRVLQFKIIQPTVKWDATYAWTHAQYAPMLWGTSDAVYATAVRSLLTPDDYQQLTRPWRTAFGDSGQG